ncbi:hypothetical protein AVEN_256510-1 [Araneus ventricosus]|uniref:Uncharacterized protein n=1 Tax=Araneus ventricosus TaxID=182803 RepID=A0A4Y2QUP6_ARAVE|nr:hypothetical protein AVEN_256510-1 [Araneus ventricosus]
MCKSDLTEVHASEVFLQKASKVNDRFPWDQNELGRTLPSEVRGVVDELSLGDSPSNWTNRPTAVVCLPPWC